MAGRGSGRWGTSDTIAVVAVVISIASAAIAIAQTQRANDISQAAYSLSEALAPQLKVFVNAIDARGVQQDGENALRVELEMVNTGEVQLSGCNTYYQNSHRDGVPWHYWPSVTEPGGVSWGLAPGESHGTVVTVPAQGVLALDPTVSEMFVAVWFECRSDELVTTAELYGIDLANGQLFSSPEPHTGEVRWPMATLPALGRYERYNIVARESGQTQMPIPTPTPAFTVGGNG